MISFLKSGHNGLAVFDPTDPGVDLIQFSTEDLSATFFGPSEEDTPSNSPVPRGTCLTIRSFVNSDHASHLVTRLSRIGFIFFLNSSPMFAYSKKQKSCKMSKFSSEFTVIKHYCEHL